MVCTDFGSSDGKPRGICRTCTNRRAREAHRPRQQQRHIEGDWLSVAPLRRWIEKALLDMPVTTFCEVAHIEGRRLWGLRYEQHYVNYYVADRILTYHQGPPIWELYPQVDERT